MSARHLLWAAFVLFTALTTYTTQAAGSKPKPPATLCVEEGGCATTLVPARPRIKWFPGHYVIMPGYNTWNPAHVAEAAELEGVKGIKIRFTWRTLEPARGVYNFKPLDEILALCRTHGLKVFVEVQERNFNTSVQDVLPAYLASEPGAGGGWHKKVDPSSGASRGYIAKLWLPSVMTRLLALHRALAGRYDDDNAFAAIGFEEIAPGHGTHNATDYSQAAWATQIKRYASETSKMWEHTPVTIKTNSLAGEVAGIINHAYLNRTGVGGPDMLPPPHTGIMGDRIIRNLETDNALVPKSDYRGKTVISYDVQTPSLGGKEGAFSPAQLADHCIINQGCNFFSWIRSTSTEINWQDHIKPYLAKAPRRTVETCPENFRGACVSN